MFCPNCGLENPADARFCSNCGASFTAGPTTPPPNQYQSQSQYQSPQPYQSPAAYQPYSTPTGGRSIAKNIGLGCLIAVVIVFFLGVSCMHGCLGGHTRYYGRHHRYV